MKNKIAIIIIAVLIVVLGIEGYMGYIKLYKNNQSTENSYMNNKEQLKSGVKLLNTKEENNEIIQEYEIVLNNKKKIIEINYKIDKNNPFSVENDVYAHIGTSDELGGVYNLVEGTPADFTKENINKNFNENNFRIIKGIDNKDYLIVFNYIFTPSGLDNQIYIFNDNYQNINKEFDFYQFGEQGLELEKDIWYEDILNLDYCQDGYCQIRMKLENNKIYYLYHEAENSCEEGTLEEREYVINNNKLEYKVVNTYKVLGVAGAC